MLLSDEELIARFQQTAGTREAETCADELLKRYSPRVLNWCWKFACQREDAADLAQDVLLKAYRNLHSFRVDAKFSTWLYLIARNHCFNYVRDRRTEPVESAAVLDVEPADRREWDTLSAMMREADLRQMRTMVNEVLDQTEAKVMMLHYGEEMPIGAITKLLGLTNPSGAKSYIVSARRKLGAAMRRLSVRNVDRHHAG